MIATEVSTAATTKTIRKRKTHTKSRRGCGNCKLRRVKVTIAQSLEYNRLIRYSATRVGQLASDVPTLACLVVVSVLENLAETNDTGGVKRTQGDRPLHPRE